MMGPTIAKKGNFDGLHNHLKNYFETNFPFLVLLMPYITSSKKHFGIKFPFLVTLVNYISDASPRPNLTQPNLI